MELRGGTFVGGPGNRGNDSVGDANDAIGLHDGHFNGGPGKDRASLCFGGIGTTVSVEKLATVVCK